MVTPLPSFVIILLLFRLHGAPFQYCVLFPKLACRMDKECDPTYLSFFSTQRKENQDTHDVPCKVSCRQCRSPLLDEGRNMRT